MSRPGQPSSRQPPRGAIGEWRRRRLRTAGFEPRLASQLAEESAVDLHELLVLLDRGCAPALAARILAPIEIEE